MSNTIYKLTHEDILDKNILDQHIYPNMEQNYYYSEEFDERFYIDLALKGFITIWYKQGEQEYLLPEIQREYAILDFKNLHTSKKVQKLLKKDTYQFFHNSDFEEVIHIINGFHQDSWVQGEYIKLLKKIIHCEYKKSFFSLSVFGIKDKLSKKIVAAEIGYSTYHNSIYTSLSGFCLRERQYNHYGNLQMVLLANYLENNNYKFWNLGHPYMEYKLQLGSKVLSRTEFIERLKKLELSKQAV